ncbi:MAG: alpha-L-fucosidase [FCB group bacterium]|nr:alpha-L-fucosidase [FCB group bacterium]MBL7120388.1 alpha-L-fucosidase [Candidatus Neomarinimicrobiota bacterium]
MKLYKGLVLVPVIVGILCGCINEVMIKESTPESKQEITSIYSPDWESLKQHETPEWFRDAKFGIYTHWGPYSVPAYYTEWYPHGMYEKDGFRNKDFFGHHTKTWGHPSEFGYKDFLPIFDGAQFDAEEWADLFQKSGARFAGPVAVHHDGFVMWDSDLTSWDAKEMGPKQDIVGELEKAIRKRDMHFVTSFHHARNWSFYDHDSSYDTGDPEYAYVGSMYGPIHEKGAPHTKEYLLDWQHKIEEVIEKYDPDLLWFDGAWGKGAFEPYKKDFIHKYYNKAEAAGKEVGITYKKDNLPEGVGIKDNERGSMADLSPEAWLTDNSVMSNSWGYIDKPKYFTSNWLIDELIDVVSKNGSMLLNVGPDRHGAIDEESKKRLLDIGKWLEMNGEAIYETRPWSSYGEGPTFVEGGGHNRRKGEFTPSDIRYTTKGDHLYIIVLDWPESGIITINNIREELIKNGTGIKHMEMLGSGLIKDWFLSESELKITFPDTKPCEHAFVLKCKLEK